MLATETIQIWAGIAASGVATAASIPYIISIIRKKTKPSLTTWLIWTLVSILLAASYRASGATFSFWITLSYVVTSASIAILSLRYGVFEATRLDGICLLAAFASVLPWLIFHSASTTLYLTIFIDVLGAAPTLKKAYIDPDTENKPAWLIAFVGNALNLLAVNTWSPEVALFPVYAFLSTGTVAALLHFRGGLGCAECSTILPLSGWQSSLASLRDGTMSRIRRLHAVKLTSSEQLKSIETFYKKNRSSPADENIVDASTGLKQAVTGYFEKLLPRVETVVDVGCGEAILASACFRASKIYVGIDLYIDKKTELAGVNFIEAPISEKIDVTPLRRGRALFVLVNLICYARSPTEVISFIRRNAQADDLILLIEPTKSIFWENYFSSIHLSLRGKRELKALLGNLNFSTICEGTIVLPIIFNFFRIDISTVLIARKR